MQRKPRDRWLRQGHDSVRNELTTILKVVTIFKTLDLFDVLFLIWRYQYYDNHGKKELSREWHGGGGGGGLDH